MREKKNAPILFRAAFKRDTDKREVLQLAQIVQGSDGKAYMASPQGRPYWNSVAMEKAGMTRQEIDPVFTVEQAIGLGYGNLIWQWGRNETAATWVWSPAAKERRKTEAWKTVFYKEVQVGDWEEGETELRIIQAPFPKKITDIIAANAIVGKYKTEITSINSLRAALEKEGWSLLQKQRKK